MSDPLSEETKANIVDLKVIVIVLGQTSEHVKLISYDRSSLHYDALFQVRRPLFEFSLSPPKVSQQSMSNAATVLIQPGWQMLGNRRARKVRVFYERNDPQHTLFCCKTLYCPDLRVF